MTLPDAIRRHAIGSMRLHDGDELQISDGEGLRIDATVRDEKQGAVQVDSFTKEEAPKLRLALVQALAKNGHDEQAIDMATQIGVDEVIPWQSARAIARFKEGRTDRKWNQVLRAATEQSRRSYVPILHDCVSTKQLIAVCRRAAVHGDLVIVLHQDATASYTQIEERINHLIDATFKDGKARTVYVVVGPEGGISDEEITALTDAGAHVCLLGHNILRASCAGAVALSLLSRSLGRYE